MYRGEAITKTGSSLVADMWKVSRATFISTWKIVLLLRTKGKKTAHLPVKCCCFFCVFFLFSSHQGKCINIQHSLKYLCTFTLGNVQYLFWCVYCVTTGVRSARARWVSWSDTRTLAAWLNAFAKKNRLVILRVVIVMTTISSLKLWLCKVLYVLVAFSYLSVCLFFLFDWSEQHYLKINPV